MQQSTFMTFLLATLGICSGVFGFLVILGIICAVIYKIRVHKLEKLEEKEREQRKQNLQGESLDSN